MRIWSLHPTYLDTKGLVALWRETLLAKHVLEGKTKGYKNHPQLLRFKKLKNPLPQLINIQLLFMKKQLKEITISTEKKLIGISANQNLRLQQGK